MRKMSMYSKLKKFLNSVAGAIVGFIEGIFLGPFALCGKSIATAHEAFLVGDPSLIIELPLVAPFFFVLGFIYGPIRGAMVGAKLGFNKSFKGVAKELFTYDTIRIHEEQAASIPESKTLLSSGTYIDLLSWIKNILKLNTLLSY